MTTKMSEANGTSNGTRPNAQEGAVSATSKAFTCMSLLDSVKWIYCWKRLGHTPNHIVGIDSKSRGGMPAKSLSFFHFWNR